MDRPLLFTGMNGLATWTEALRVKHWLKGGFCLAALFFHGDGLNVAAWFAVIPIVVAFSLVSSAGYLLNDVINLEEDRHHPRKSKRPLARGVISTRAAGWVMAGLVICAFGLTYWFYGWSYALATIVGYYALQWAYSLVFRQWPFIDVMVLGLSFVARAAGGAFALRLIYPDLIPTGWLLLCTYFLSLLLGFGKRKGEWALMVQTHHEVGETRWALRGYTPILLDTLIVISLLLVGGTYVIYCSLRSDRELFLLTALPALWGLMSYLRLAWRSPDVEAPENLLLKDPVLLVLVVGWVGMIVYITAWN